VFSSGDHDVGLTSAVRHEIPLAAGTTPVRQPTRRLGPGEGKGGQPTSSRSFGPRPHRARTQCMELAGRSGPKERRQLAVLCGLTQIE